MSRDRGWSDRIAVAVHRWGRTAGSGWYELIIVLLAAADAFIFIVPIEVLLVPAVLARRRHWYLAAFWVTLGSALGAALFAWLATRYGASFVHELFEFVPFAHSHSDAWARSERFLTAHGFLGLAVVSASPFPQHPAVAIAGLMRMNALVVFAAVLAGRLVKYEVLSWAVVYAPHVLRRIGIMRKREG